MNVIAEVAGTEIPLDGRARLFNPRAIRQQLRLQDNYDFSPKFGTKGPSGNYRVSSGKMCSQCSTNQIVYMYFYYNYNYSV